MKPKLINRKIHGGKSPHSSVSSLLFHERTHLTDTVNCTVVFRIRGRCCKLDIAGCLSTTRELPRETTTKQVDSSKINRQSGSVFRKLEDFIIQRLTFQEFSCIRTSQSSPFLPRVLRYPRNWCCCIFCSGLSDAVAVRVSPAALPLQP